MGIQIEIHFLKKMRLKRRLSQADMFVHGVVLIWVISPKLIVNPHLAKSHSFITYIVFAQTFCNFAQSTAVVLSCSVQNFKMIGQLKWVLRMNEISRDFSLIKVFVGWSGILYCNNPDHGIAVPAKIAVWISHPKAVNCSHLTNWMVLTLHDTENASCTNYIKAEISFPRNLRHSLHRNLSN